MTQAPDNQQQRHTNFVNWFRDSSPYIHGHRQRVFVISFGGEAVQDHSFANHVHDFALLNSLGIQLVLVHGIRPQIDQRLSEHPSTFVNHLRITDKLTLQYVKAAAGTVRVEIEALLSMGLANSPMAGAKVRVVSGNFITAKPIGVIDGIDFEHTGTVRRIDQENIRQQLELNNVVLISPVGYSPSGEVFNLCAEDVATEVAIALQAEKLILMTEKNIINPSDEALIAQLTCSQAASFLQQNPTLDQTIAKPLNAATRACQAGVKRAHLINRNYDGALLLELFSRDGIGTLISANPYEELRPATINDIAGILELIGPLEQQDKLIKRSREHLEMEIDDYQIIERDGLIIGCIALHLFPDSKAGEIACLAVHPEYRQHTRGQQLLSKATNLAKQQGLQRLFVLSTQTMHWFIEQGYQPVDKTALPDSLISAYNSQRNSKVLQKNIG
jgi:amino-acid N-acetyltransferase